MIGANDLVDPVPEPAPLRVITIRFIVAGRKCEAHPERSAIVELECHEDGSAMVPRLLSCVVCLEEWAGSYLDDHAINPQAIYDAAGGAPR
jgi:hypothetical protein